MEILLPLSSRVQVREQILKNQLNGDRTSFRGAPWDIYGADISGYDSSFFELLEYKSISSIVGQICSPTVVDIMSPTDALASLFSQLLDKDKLGISVSLEDLRSDSKKQRDNGLNVKQIAGDILKSSTWRKIQEHLQGRKADLIMERAVRGTECIPNNLALCQMLLRRAWNILNSNNGILLFQMPVEMWEQESSISRWINVLSESGINAEIDTSNVVFTMKMVRTPKAPEKLPFLK